MTRDEYARRRAALRKVLPALHHGRLEIGGSGGGEGMLFVRAKDGAKFFIGGANDAAVAQAIVDAVNFALDCCDPPTP